MNAVRAAFERWAAAYSTQGLERDDQPALGVTGYASIEQTMQWHAWQAAAKTNAPEGASEGESGANVKPGLAGLDDTCNHVFQLHAKSSIRMCAHCGLSELTARNRAEKLACGIIPPMPLTTKEKQQDYRARQALLGLKEVRGLYLPPELHYRIKKMAEQLLASQLEAREAQKPKE